MIVTGFIRLLSDARQSGPTHPSTINMLSTMGIRTEAQCTYAIAPTANGKTAAPVDLNAAEKPMLPTCKCGGRILVAETMAAGNSGPRKNPTSATAIVEVKELGMSPKMR